MMKEEQPAERNKLIRKIKRISGIILYGMFGGSYDKTLKNIEQGEELTKYFQGDLPAEIKPLQTQWLYLKGVISSYRGNLALSFEYANEHIRVAQLNNDKRAISNGIFMLGNYYWLSGDFDNALVHIDRAIRILEENLNEPYAFINLPFQLMQAIGCSIVKEDRERAKIYFKRLEEMWELNSEGLYINDNYLMGKAFLLKSSMRSRDRVIAEDLFREIIENASSNFTYKLRALVAVCELLLVELRISNDITIVDEIKTLIEKLSGMAQHSGLNYHLIEAYILHGKLALITFDMESSRRYSTQAQRMAEKYGFINLANQIAGLRESMLEKKDIWEHMEKNDAPLSERMDLARLDDHLNGKFRRLMMKMERVAEPPPKKEVF